MKADLVEIAGMAVVGAGIGLIYWPAAVIYAGICIVVCGILSRKRADT